ncbi:50S ribosomal protein L15 [bacterium]|nr:50S ribosomal protein L15 [bacterium]
MLDKLKPCEGSRKKRKRIGRGAGSGHGGTSCKGHKGQNARSGGGKGPGFEGGQMPLQRRLPKRGFRNIFKKSISIINLKDINRLEQDVEITPQALKQKGIIKANVKYIKVLSDGNLEKALTFNAHSFSKEAVKKIEAMGGKAEVIGS